MYNQLPKNIFHMIFQQEKINEFKKNEQLLLKMLNLQKIEYEL